MKFKICIPLPIKSSNFEVNREIIKQVLKTGPDLIELRFDYIENIQIINEKFVVKLLKLIQPKIPVIFTMRDFNEGGQIDISKENRLKILDILIKANPNYLDIEMNTDNSILEGVINLCIQREIVLIFSYHNFDKTIGYINAVNIINKFRKKLETVFSMNSKILRDCIFKFIFTAQSFEDNFIPLKLSEEFNRRGFKIISFCMGELGIFSRITCVKVGSYFTYASFEDKTAPSQIKIEKIKEIHQLLFNQ